MILGGPKTKSDLDKEIERVIRIMSQHEPDSPEYAKINKQLKGLNAQKVATRRPEIDPNTYVTIGANLAGILLIVGHERAHVITSRAIGFVRTLR